MRPNLRVTRGAIRTRFTPYSHQVREIHARFARFARDSRGSRRIRAVFAPGSHGVRMGSHGFARGRQMFVPKSHRFAQIHPGFAGFTDARERKKCYSPQSFFTRVSRRGRGGSTSTLEIRESERRPESGRPRPAESRGEYASRRPGPPVGSAQFGSPRSAPACAARKEKR